MAAIPIADATDHVSVWPNDAFMPSHPAVSPVAISRHAKLMVNSV